MGLDVSFLINQNRPVNNNGRVLNTGTSAAGYVSVSGILNPASGIVNREFNWLDSRFDDSDYYRGGYFSFFQAEFITASSVQLDWTHNINNRSFTGFQIQRSLDNSTWTTVYNLPTGVISQVDGDLQGETQLFYQVRATGINNYHSSWKQAAAVTTLIGISGFMAVTNSSSGIILSWQDISTTNYGYQLDRSTNGTTWANLANLAGNASGYVDYGLPAEAHRYYRIKATGLQDGSFYYDNAYTNSVISGFIIQSTTASSMQLFWQDLPQLNDGYKLEKSLNGSSWSTIYDLNGVATGQLVSALDAETFTYFRLQATGSIVDSLLYTTSGYTLSSISGLVAAANSTSGIDLTWQDVANLNTGYTLQRSTDNSTWNTTYNLNANASSYTDYTLSPDTAYYFRLKATGVLTNSDFYTVADYTFGVTSGNPLASTFVNDSGNGGTIAWLVPSGASISDNVYASGEYTGATQTTQILKGFNPFSISTVPTGVTIKGVIVDVEYNVASTSVFMTNNTMKLYVNSAISGTNNTGGGWPTLDGSDHIASYGGQTDLWGLSSVLTPTIVNASGFGVGIAMNNYAGL